MILIFAVDENWKIVGESDIHHQGDLPYKYVDYERKLRKNK